MAHLSSFRPFRMDKRMKLPITIRKFIGSIRRKKAKDELERRLTRISVQQILKLRDEIEDELIVAERTNQKEAIEIAKAKKQTIETVISYAAEPEGK